VDQVGEGLPGGGVSEVDVIEDDDDRVLPGEVGQRHGQGLEKLELCWLSVRDGASNDRHASEQPGQIIQESATDGDHLLGGNGAQVTLKGLGPQPERSGAPERVAARREDEGPRARTSQELGGQPGLPYSSLADEKNAPSVSDPGLGKPAPQYGKLSRPSNESGAAGPGPEAVRGNPR
jgi:hypothetical protein